MTCRGFIRLLLKVINILFILVGLAMIGYGIYMVITYENSSSSTSPPPPPPPPSTPPPPPPPSSDRMYLPSRSTWSNNGNERAANGINAWHSRRVLPEHLLLNEFSSVSSFLPSPSTAWFLYTIVGVGIIITLITCSGCIAASTVNGCCLSCYSCFVGLFIIIQLSLAAFIYFYQNWQDVIPDDSTGELDNIEDFITDKFGILKWVALGVIILQVIAMVLAIILRCLRSSTGTDYDSDDEYLGARSTRQPVSRQGATATAGTTDSSARSNAWSTRMREKYGLDTRDFTYKPAESRQAQQSTGAEESKSKCRVM